MTSGVSDDACPDSLGDGDALSETLLKGVELWRLRRGRLKLLLGWGVLYWRKVESSVSMVLIEGAYEFRVHPGD
jgi:hypothetical protein